LKLLRSSYSCGVKAHEAKERNSASIITDSPAGLQVTFTLSRPLDDIKHKVANLLKKRLRNDERWKAFSAKLGSTTARKSQSQKGCREIGLGLRFQGGRAALGSIPSLDWRGVEDGR
jgi:hypothetical protein